MSAEGSWMRQLTANMPLKLLSLVLSIALFSLVHSDQDGQRTLFIDVVALLPPDDSARILVSDLPHQVKVTLRGSNARLKELARGELGPIQMDLTDTTRRYFYFGPGSLEVGGGLQVVEIEPSTVALEWVASEIKRVSVDAATMGEPGPGLVVRTPIEVRPGVVRVRGPVDKVVEFTVVRTDVVEVGGLSEGEHSMRVPLQPLPPNVTYVDDVMVEVRLQVQPELSERTFRRLGVSAVGRGVATLRPQTVAVTLRGPKQRLEAYDSDLLVPYVELPQEGPVGTMPLPVKLRGDLDGLQTVKVVPAEVLVQRHTQPAPVQRAEE